MGIGLTFPSFYGKVVAMGRSVTTKLDSGGRIVIPKRFRERYGFRPGDTVRLFPGDDGLSIVSGETERRFVRHGAVLAIQTDPGSAPLSAFDVETVREAHLEEKSGARRG